MFLTDIIVFSSIGMVQMFGSVWFTWKTRHVEEVSRWLKVMTFLPNFTWSSYATLQVFYLRYELGGVHQAVISMIAKFAMIVNFGYLITMVRVQVQLRAEKESTKVIIEAIDRSIWTERGVKLLLILYQITYFFFYFFAYILPERKELSVYSYNLAGIW